MKLRDEIIDYWLNQVGPKGWYAGGAELDAEIRDRFAETWAEVRAHDINVWHCSPRGVLAYLILMDQFPRNMFRDTADAFATDHLALSTAKIAIDRKWDLEVPEPDRQFFYLPLMHSENSVDQDRCVRLMAERMPRTGADNLRHARAHRAVIRRFGRFPYRNAALGRETSQAELDWMAAGGYGQTLQEIDTADAA